MARPLDDEGAPVPHRIMGGIGDEGGGAEIERIPEEDEKAEIERKAKLRPPRRLMNRREGLEIGPERPAFPLGEACEIGVGMGGIERQPIRAAAAPERRIEILKTPAAEPGAIGGEIGGDHRPERGRHRPPPRKRRSARRRVTTLAIGEEGEIGPLGRAPLFPRALRHAMPGRDENRAEEGEREERGRAPRPETPSLPASFHRRSLTPRGPAGRGSGGGSPRQCAARAQRWCRSGCRPGCGERPSLPPRRDYAPPSTGDRD